MLPVHERRTRNEDGIRLDRSERLVELRERAAVEPGFRARECGLIDVYAGRATDVRAARHEIEPVTSAATHSHLDQL
jgi:hypothetical protein